MTAELYEFEFLTPCFCGGADPARAELRAPSIRGRLRWWFRALGGSREDEEKVFGSVGGGRTSPGASSLAVRVVKPPEGGDSEWTRLLGRPKGGLYLVFSSKQFPRPMDSPRSAAPGEPS